MSIICDCMISGYISNGFPTFAMEGYNISVYSNVLCRILMMVMQHEKKYNIDPAASPCQLVKKGKNSTKTLAVLKQGLLSVEVPLYF